MIKAPAIFAMLLALTGCGREVPATPKEFQSQVPPSLPSGSWHAVGRLSISYPKHRFSADCHLKRDGDELRFVLLDDSGVLLADVKTTGKQTTVVQAVDGVRKRLDDLGAVLRLAFLPPTDEKRRWKQDRLIGTTADATRIYGGVPVELRLIKHHGWPLTIADLRECGDGKVPFSVIANGHFNATIALTLREVASDK